MEKSAKSPNTAGSISLMQAQHCWLRLEIIAPTNLIRSNLKATAKLYMFCVWCNFLSLCYSWRGNDFRLRRLKLGNLWPHDYVKKKIMSRDFDRHLLVWVWRADDSLMGTWHSQWRQITVNLIILLAMNKY